jgi:hypothetical protein
VRSTLSQRSRSQSIKRKNSGDGNDQQVSYANIAAGSGNECSIEISDTEEEQVTEGIIKVKSLCDKVSSEVSKADIDPNLVAIFSTINEAIGGLCDNQLKITEKLTAQGKQNSQGNNPAIASQATKRFRSATGPQTLSQFVPSTNMVDLATLRGRSTDKVTVDPAISKFKEAVKEAEKSTLIFNLNLGKIPIMNQDTISTNATKALTELAAANEKSKGKIPSVDTMSAIDDVLSVVQGMKFFGRTTKSYQRSNDPNSGSYCTVPIRYDFADKSTREYAETVLRDKCKVSCTTPYPTILRETIRQVINGVRSEYPDYYVKVTVDTSKMCLKVAMRPKLEPGSTESKTWYTLDNPVPIPSEALDLSARKVPDGFKVSHEYRKSKRGDQTSMETEQVECQLSQPIQVQTANTPTKKGSPSKKPSTTPGTQVRKVLQD